MVTQQRLKKLFTYDNGNLKRITGTRKVGYINNKGYIRISIDGKSYFAHHLVWLYFNGTFPEKPIDHINHVRSDNRIENLRLVTNADNSKNMKQNKNNKTGIVGVSWNSKARKWSAEITVDLKQIKLGMFTTIQEAMTARTNAEIKYNFHENHGENKPNWEYISKMNSKVNYAKKGDHIKKKVIQLSLNGLEIAVFDSAKDAENATNISRSKIGMVCNGKRKTAGKYKWQWV